MISEIYPSHQLCFSCLMGTHFVFALKNYRMAIIAAGFFGCIAPGAKYLTKELPPVSLAGIMYFSAGLGLFFLLLLKGNLKSSLEQFGAKDRKWLAAATLFGGIIGPTLLTFGLRKMSGSSASLLLNLESVLTSLIAWFVFKEHFEKRIVWGMVFIIFGCVILSSGVQDEFQQDSLLGFVYICGACLAWGIDNNVTRNISHLDPLFTASFKGLIAGSANLLLAYLVGEILLLNSQLLMASLLGFLGIGISLVAFIKSLERIGTARTGALFSTAPFIGSLLSIIILRESISTPFMIALALMGCGVAFHLTEKHDHEHLHPELTHNHEHVHDEHHQHQHEASDPLEEPHHHTHLHQRMNHRHSHFPDTHHQHLH